MKRTVQLAVVAAIIITLGSCVWNPTDDTGSVTLAISSPALSSLAVGDSGMEKADSDAVRIWLYYDGVELPVTDVGYVQATVDPGTVKELTIENLPEGDGYSIAVVRGVMGVMDSVVFQPVAIGDADFVVTGGRETAVAVTTTQLDELVRVDSVDYSLLGEDLVGAAYIDYSFSGISSGGFTVAATESKVFVNGSSNTLSGLSTAFSQINSLSLVDLAGVSTAFFNTDVGILNATPTLSGITPVFAFDDDLAVSMTAAAISDIVGSGVFQIDDGGTTGLAVFYERLGGLGGTFIDGFGQGGVGLGSIVADDWTDTGTELADYVASDQSPVFAYATSGLDAAYMSTRLGTFRLTKELFDGDEISADALLDSSVHTPGLDFFAIAYPGSTRPLKIRHMALAGSGTSEKLVIGSPRGAFLFPSSAVESLDANGLVSGVVTVEAVRDQEVKNLTVVEVDGVDYIVAVTDERIVVVADTNATPLFMQPVRALVLGEPQELSAYESGSGVLTLLISGSEGLTKLDVEIP